jgi:hypothetical protein
MLVAITTGNWPPETASRRAASNAESVRATDSSWPIFQFGQTRRRAIFFRRGPRLNRLAADI